MKPFLAAVLLFTSSAYAVDFAIKVEPGIAIPLTTPQSQIYGIGGSQSVKVLFGLSRYIDIGPSVSFLLLPSRTPGEEGGTGWTFGAGARFKRPHDAERFFGISPWVDADLLFMRTGDLNRPAFDAAVGLSVPIGERRTFWVGPFVRYLHVIQPNRVGFDNHDAKVLTLGISFEVGSGIERPREEVVAAAHTTEQVVSCPDGDGDSVPDTIDRCPMKAGPIENFGCPVYKKLVVQKDKLELKEKLYFEWNKATLEVASFPVLDEVVEALNDNKNFRVQVEGHTDSTGTDDHNQTLSEQRAQAVLDYLVLHGVPKDRLVSKGFSSSVPIRTNDTPEGRDANRRVEFVVHFMILPTDTAK